MVSIRDFLGIIENHQIRALHKNIRQYFTAFQKTLDFDAFSGFGFLSETMRITAPCSGPASRGQYPQPPRRDAYCRREGSVARIAEMKRYADLNDTARIRFDS